MAFLKMNEFKKGKIWLKWLLVDQERQQIALCKYLGSRAFLSTCLSSCLTVIFSSSTKFDKIIKKKKADEILSRRQFLPAWSSFITVYIDKYNCSTGSISYGLYGFKDLGYHSDQNGVCGLIAQKDNAALIPSCVSRYIMSPFRHWGYESVGQ
jgi:hypothetical protein